MGLFVAGLSVDLAPVTEADHLNADSRILNVGDDAVVPDPVFPVVAQRGSSERLTDTSWIVEYGYTLAQEFDDASSNLFIELFQFLLGLFFKLNQPGQDASPLHRA